MKRVVIKLGALIFLTFIFVGWMKTRVYEYYVPTTIDDFFLPGSQPLESGTFVSPSQCDNCHGGYDQSVEPAFTWRGSMMAHSMRDPLFEASLAIANQDAIFSGDVCIRCHSPVGWLEGRSTPTDGSALTAADREGVQCHFCHRLIDPMSTDAGDLTYLSSITNVPTVHGNGMFVVDDSDVRRGPYAGIQAPHDIAYSEFYGESDYCATCHDVSNPAYSKQPDGTYLPNSLGSVAPSFDTYDLFPVERTFSEWKMSAYNSSTGIPSAVFGGNKANVISCQDCHMRDVTGKGCDKNYAPIRTDLPLHDLTGGNTFIPELIKTMYPAEVDENAMDAGILRARYMLQNAATLNLNVNTSQDGYNVEVEVINETGHKLPSGYPEGRRMWINLVAFDQFENVIQEFGAYNSQTGDLVVIDTKVYEAKLGMSPEIVAVANANGNGTYQAGESFHFALNNMIVKDNRIPPRGFTNAGFASVQAAPVGYSYPDGAYSDITSYTIPANTYKVRARLYYQTVSKEYIEFLNNNNSTNTKGQELYNLWVAHGRSAPELMQEAEFYTGTLGLNGLEVLEDTIKIFPNPTAETVHIKFNLDRASYISINLYTLSGVRVRTSDKGLLSSGNHFIDLNVNDLSKGTYIISLNINGTSITKLLVVD